MDFMSGSIAKVIRQILEKKAQTSYLSKFRDPTRVSTSTSA